MLSLSDINTVLLHDWLTDFRGGERILEAFCELFPTAPIYTLIHKEQSSSQIIESHPIKTSFLNRLPGIHTHYRKFLPLFPLATQKLSISEPCQLVLSGSHCTIKGISKPKGSTHICYIHSPMRYIYDQYDSYFGPQAPLYQQVGARLFRPYLTSWDLNSNHNVDYFIANSSFVQNRVQQIYKKECVVIHPFVDTEEIFLLRPKKLKRQEYYLMVTAFAPNKRVDLAIEAFNKNKKLLKIIGGGQDESRLRSLANSNIEFLGRLDRSQVISHMSEAQGFIFPGVEDFGITPLESLLCETPVIAYSAGGALETLSQDTAIFFNKPHPDDLNQAISQFEKSSFSSEQLVSQALLFSKKAFITKLTTFINQALASPPAQ